MNTIKSRENKELKIKYLNIILITLILSALINSSIIIFREISKSANILLLIIIFSLPFIFGGILSGFSKEGQKKVLGGVLVGAITTTISAAITLLIYGLITLPVSEWSFYIPLGIIYTIPLLIIGAFLGLFGSFIGIMIRKWQDK
jgi:hypothetical protein